MNYRDRAKRYHEAIRRILLEEWDPIGVSDVAEAQDEYDSYVSGVYGRLIRHVSDKALFAYLWEIETQHMGLYGNRQRTEQVVQSLVRVRQQLEDDAS